MFCACHVANCAQQNEYEVQMSPSEGQPSCKLIAASIAAIIKSRDQTTQG